MKEQDMRKTWKNKVNEIIYKQKENRNMQLTKKKGIRENETCIEREQRTKLHCKKNEMYWIAEGEKIRYVFFKYKELKF